MPDERLAARAQALSPLAVLLFSVADRLHMLANARILSPIAERAGTVLFRDANGASPKPLQAPADASAAGSERLATDPSFEITACETRAAFDALETDWNDLFARAGRDVHAFQTFNFAWHWCNHFLAAPSDGRRSNESLYVVTLRRGGRLALLWPLVRSRRAGIVRLSTLGEPISQYSDLIVEDAPDKEALIAAAFDYVSRHSGADLIYLRRVRSDSNAAALTTRPDGIFIERFEAPFLDLASAPNFDTYEKRYSSKARRNRRRFQRRFEERAPTATETHRSGTRARELAELAIHLKRAWLKDRGIVSPALMDPRTKAFFGAVAEAGERGAECHVTSISSRGEPAAIEIAFDCRGRRAVHLIVYALKFERVGAGQLLIESSLRNGYKTGIARYDLLTPADPYKLDWADAVVPVSDWAYAWSPLGRLYAAGYLARLRPWLKKKINAASARLKQLTRRGETQAPSQAASEE